MKRIGVVSVVWVVLMGVAAGVAYWAGLRQGRRVWIESDLQIVQPLSESQRQLLLRTAPAHVSEGMVVTVSEPGAPAQLFLAKGKLDLPDQPPKKPNPPLNIPSNDDRPRRTTEIPEYVPYPCRVGHDSAGHVVWGVCFRRKF